MRRDLYCGVCGPWRSFHACPPFQLLWIGEALMSSSQRPRTLSWRVAEKMVFETVTAVSVDSVEDLHALETSSPLGTLSIFRSSSSPRAARRIHSWSSCNLPFEVPFPLLHRSSTRSCFVHSIFHSMWSICPWTLLAAGMTLRRVPIDERHVPRPLFHLRFTCGSHLHPPSLAETEVSSDMPGPVIFWQIFPSIFGVHPVETRMYARRTLSVRRGGFIPTNHCSRPCSVPLLWLWS